MMLINDLIILGRACPEPLRDGRITVCLAGWSATLGFVRIYPTRPDMGWHRWNVVKVEVERNKRDTREESWKIAGAGGEWETLAQKIKVVDFIKDPIQRRELVGNLTDTCVQVINEEHRSLGIIKPEILKVYFKENSRYGEMWQMGLPGFTDMGTTEVKRDFPFEPRIRYRCPDCQTKSGYHDQVVLEWGFYKWFVRCPEKKGQVWENAEIGQENRDIYLLVGNQAARRTSFMIISVLRVPSGPVTLPLFPLPKRSSDVSP